MSLTTGHLQEKVIDFFFPRRCIGCGKIGDLLCPDCTKKLPRLVPPFCRKCGKPESSGVLCPACWGQQTDIDGIRSVFRFEGTARRAVHELKYRNLKSIAVYLAKLMTDYLRDNPIQGDVLVAVPLHSRRLRERGYNQSSLLADKLGNLAEIPVLEDYLCRIKDSLPQARTVTVEQRRKNVKKAFSCQPRKLEKKAVILVDDVCTSGATLESCATALKRAGAISVWGFTFAREI